MPPSVASRTTQSDAWHSWFASRGWAPFEFQHRTWNAYLEGRSGLVHAPTGMGKTLAVFGGPVMEYLNSASSASRPQDPTLSRPSRKPARAAAEPLRVLWVTPMRALATDTVKSLLAPIEDLALPWTIEKRTGDTTQTLRAKQKERLPTTLVTTPESLTLLLSYPGARERFASLRAVIVDEWHELLSTKRGTQTELALARLRAWNSGARTWGLSATLGNLDQALEVLVERREPQRHRDTEGSQDLNGSDSIKKSSLCLCASAVPPPVLIPGETKKQIEIRTILPDSAERFPWAGHLGLTLLDKVIPELERARTTLLFTNTRSQAELWFQALTSACPQWLGLIAIHHGSLDRAVREEVEELLRCGKLKCVVCTSSLDLGVDFSPVEQVIQVGSPKGVARLLQRAGRSGHQPGAVSTVIGVPTNAMEILEFSAARDAMLAREIEAREPLERPLDVLAQHLVTVALAEPFDERELLAEVRTAYAYRNLTDEEWGWCLDFVTTGGPTLRAYPQYARLLREHDYRPASPAIERMHRLGIGTITSEASMKLAYQSGRTLGTIEEDFIARLNRGDRFVFGGELLELVRVHQMTAQVKKAKGNRGIVPRWDGGRTPLSTQLAHAVRRRINSERETIAQSASTHHSPLAAPELTAVRPLLTLQAAWSRLPAPDELLIESIETREGYHIFLFPFDGRLVHEGVGAVLAHRLAALSPRTLSVTSNDLGIELLSADPLPSDEPSWRALLSTERLLEDLLACLNSTELTRRQFRDIARVAGLILPSFPGSRGKTTKQIQASSELFFDVFQQFDPENMLLGQARREVLEQQLELGRLRAALGRLTDQRLTIVTPPRLTPFSFALWAESLRTQHITSERWSDRVKKMVAVLEAEAGSATTMPKEKHR